MPHLYLPARLRLCSLLLLALAAWSAAPAAPAPAPGTVSGVVSNAATGNLLPGASVRLPVLGLSARADDTGRYVLQEVAAGEHELVATYAGL
ncbi:MAG: CarboxypepD reg-like domain, partial [Verrucomicrobiota bacterium]